MRYEEGLQSFTVTIEKNPLLSKFWYIYTSQDISTPPLSFNLNHGQSLYYLEVWDGKMM